MSVMEADDGCGCRCHEEGGLLFGCGECSDEHFGQERSPRWDPFSEECECDCHDTGGKHVIACCAPCPHCGKRIGAYVPPEAHIRRCAMNPDCHDKDE